MSMEIWECGRLGNLGWIGKEGNLRVGVMDLIE